MTKKHLVFFGFAVLLVLSEQVFAQKLSLPYKDVGACPFECCTYREWTANKPTTLLKNMSDGSTVAFKIRKGEKVQGVTGTVITTKAGIGVATRNASFDDYDEKRNTNRNVAIKKGERFLILTYLGEGIYKVWYKGRMLQASMDDSQLKILSDPKSVWWVKIKNRRGQIGWTKLNGNFDNMDSCG